MTDSAGERSVQARARRFESHSRSASATSVMSPVASVRRGDAKEATEASLGEITKGLVLFSTSIALYSVYTLMIKVMM